MKFSFIIRRIEGHSMWPTLGQDDIVVASSLMRLRSGSIVIAKVGNREYVKRVESIENNQVRLIGDNYFHSHDSRQFGLVDKKQILGTVFGYPKTFNGLERPFQQS